MFSLLVQAEYADDLSHPFVVTGVIINSENANLIEQFVNYLAKRTDYPLKVLYVSSYAELSKALRTDPEAIAWNCGAPYVQDHIADGQQLVVVPLFNNSPTYYSVILARQGRKEKKLADFKAGVLAYSDPRSNSGFLSPKYSLYKQGININQHFRLLLNAGNHEGSIESLINGLADVAAVDEYIWFAYKKNNPQAKNQLHELERMGPFPFTPIVAGRKVSRVKLEKLASVLLNMSENPEGRELLNKFYLNGFVNKNNEFYKPIKDMLDEVEIESVN